MLKLFYKMLLVSVLSGSLMLMDFSAKGVQLQSAYAGEKVETKVEAGSDIGSTLTMTAVGLLTSRLYMCQMTADMMVAAGAGAAFIAGEVLSTIKMKKFMKDQSLQIERDKNGNINQEQVKALERLKQFYEEARKTANTKKTLQKTAMVAFLAAAATAIALAFKEKTAMTACSGALGTAGGACQGLTPSTTANSGFLAKLFAQREIPAPSNAKFANQTADEATEKAKEGITSATAGTLASQHASICASSYGSSPSCGWAVTCASAPATYSATCAAITPVLKATTGYCPAPLALMSQNSTAPANGLYAKFTQPQLFIMSLLSSMMAPKEAKADLFTPLGIISSAAITFLLMTSKTLGTTIDSYLISPTNRAIIWGVLGGLAKMSMSATDGIIGQIDQNISKIDKILNAMYNNQGTATAQTIQKRPVVETTIKPGGNLALGAVDYEDIDLSGEGGGALPCYTGSDSAHCKSLDSQVKDLPSFTGLDGESQKQLSGILAVTNGFNGTNKITKGTLNGAANLAAANAAFNASVAKGKEKLEKAGYKINFDAETKKLSDKMAKDVNDALKNGKTNAADMMASMYGAKPGSFGGGSSTASASDSDKKAEDETLKKGVAAATAINIAAPSDPALAITEEGADVFGKQPTAEEVAAYNEATKGAASMEDYELKNDITKDSSSSIFELISNRYQRSGYPRLFKVKEPEPVKK